MVKVFEHPLSPYAQKVKIALYEKGVPFDAVTPDILGGGDANFAAANPRLEVPALVDGDVRVFDSTVILEYIEDKWPTPPLLPSAPAERARVRMIEELCDTYYEAINWGIAEIRVFGRATGALAEQMLARADRQIAGMNARLERELGTRSYFNGDQFGWGDLSVYPYVAGATSNGFPPPSGSALAQWLDRVSARDSVKQCVAAVMEILPTFQNLKPIIDSGMFVREYRDHRLEWMMRSGGQQVVLDGMAKKNIRFSVEFS
ncbi:MAG TPA: glutathione S-transferase family protein [Candidatus Binatia bacterium]|nr:glutathione S-transferase family protein [Candidatus Binatia bacterium]